MQSLDREPLNTHQVNITALTGEGPPMGEAVIVGGTCKALLRARLGRQS